MTLNEYYGLRKELNLNNNDLCEVLYFTRTEDEKTTTKWKKICFFELEQWSSEYVLVNMY